MPGRVVYNTRGENKIGGTSGAMFILPHSRASPFARPVGRDSFTVPLCLIRVGISAKAVRRSLG